MTARCTEAGWPVASATVAGVPALRLGAGISGSLSMELVLGANASTRGAAVPGGGDLQPRLRLGWTPGDAGTDGPSEGILCLAAGPDRLVVGRAGIIAEAMATGLDRPADPDVHWVRGALAARRAEGAVITVAARLVGPPLVVGLAPDAAGLGLVGEIRFTDPATAADWAATADRLRQGADALIDGLEPQLQALFFPRGIPPGGEAAAATALADVRERLAAAVAGLRTRSDGDTVRVVTVLPGYSADRLLDGLSGRQ
jgi:hypothetical protein